MKKLLLVAALFLSPAFAEDSAYDFVSGPSEKDSDQLYIVSPYEGEIIEGAFTLQVQDPWGRPDSIQAVMKLDVDRGPDRLVWRGLLKASDNYAIQIDTSRFPPGEYEIDVRYRHQGRTVDEDIDVYIMN